MIQEDLDNAISYLYQCRLTLALNILKPIFDAHPKLKDAREIEDISNTLDIMRHYMIEDVTDPDRKKLYRSLVRRTFRVASDLMISWRCKNIGFYITQFQKAAHLNMSPDFIRTVLETFVSDVALLSINTDDREGKREDLYQRHQQFIERLFASLTIACQWSDGERDFWSELLTSPTIDNNDALVLASAITISAMNQFDANKTLALAYIYSNAVETSLRERALTGFVFSLYETCEYDELFPEIVDKVKEIANTPEAAHEIFELQEQIFYCMNADRDTKKIQNDIMPEITQHSPYRVNGSGTIEEKEDDRLREILHPDAEDKAMEEIEKSMQKISDMQKQGADIYFGGFSYMKRFPFFSVAANWFLPYSTEQPEVGKIRHTMGNNRFIDMVLTKSSFCESDKYSFTFAVAQVYNRLPANIREMLNTNQAIDFGMHEGEADNPTLIRRLYLQDLYRFFRLHPQHADMTNPFDEEKTLFVKDISFADTKVTRFYPSLAVFLYEQKRFNDLDYLLTYTFTKRQKDTLTYLLLKGECELHEKQYGTAVEYFIDADKMKPDDEIVLRGLAKSAMKSLNCDIAEKTYERLLEITPGVKEYLINRIKALLIIRKYDEASNVIYEADYRFPGDYDVMRLKGRLLLYTNKADEAINEYEKLMTADNPTDDDHFYYGLALWFCHRIKEAADAFVASVAHSQTPDNDLPYMLFNIGEELYKMYGIDLDDTTLMEELLCARI